MINFMETPEDLEELSQDLWMDIQKSLTAIHHALEKQGVYALFTEETTRENLLFSRYHKLLTGEGCMEFSIAAASAQSGGKSTLFNAVLTYPLLAAAVNTTTACATEIHYGKHPSVQVQYYGEHDGKFEEGPTLRGEDKLNDTLWRRLLEFACLCIEEKVICAETLQYYADKRLSKELPQWSDLKMSPDDPRQVVQLLLILLTVYVGQNDGTPQENRVRVCEERNRLLRELHIDPKRDYSVLVRWDNPLLERGLVLIDLPGFGANAKEIVDKDGRIRRSHDAISIDYIQNADAVFLFFDVTGMAGDIPNVLKVLLDGERMKYVVTKENRIIPIINKVDLAESKIPFTTDQVRSILKDLEAPVVYPIAALAGEYRLVENGLFSITGTQTYWELPGRNRQDFQKAFQKFNHRLPTEDEVKKGIFEDLKDWYYHPYEFTDLDGNSYAQNLDQWLRMMTSDYINIMYTLRGVELLQLGLRANKVIVEKINGRIAMLRMLQAGGTDLTQELVKTLEDAVTGCLQDFNEELGDLQQKIIHEIVDQATNQGAVVRASYQAAFQTIEKDIAGTIRRRANQMQANIAGNYIIDPDETFTSSGRQAAQKNKAAYENMLTDVKNFSVDKRMKSSENKLVEMMNVVQKTYNKGIPKLISLYREISQQVVSTMDSSYDSCVKAAKDSEKFDRVYGELYRQLKDSIIDQIDQFVETGISVLTTDTRITSRHKEAINAASKLSLEHQVRYRDASETYVKTLQSNAIIASHAFNMSMLNRTLETPFFSADKQKAWAAEALEPFTGDYYKDVKVILEQIGKDMQGLNRAGLEGSVKGMSAFIRQKIVQGSFDIDTEISELRFYMQELILKNTQRLMNHIEPKTEMLHGYAWATQEVDGVESAYRELETAVADGMHD